jgi:prolyl-tRNA synthetase
MPKSKHMPKEENIGVTQKKDEDISEWYAQVCQKSELADYAPVKGCMIIRPNGYAIWQAVQDYFNARLKKLKVRNAYFPLFIPESFFAREAKHAEGFKPEVAWLDKELTGEGERLAVRPTSETIMYESYSQWIRSHRDLPLRINQWCNVVRWETEATKLFMRSREFLWQEGHCVYETEKQCHKDTIKFIREYQKLAEEVLAIPVLIGKKTEKEKFAGAKNTYTIEAFMPDGKALQCGTSHDLGQGFAKSFNIAFKGEDSQDHTPWQNSWGFSTRLIGALVMTHSDDKGLVLPPAVAENKAVVVPIIFENTKEQTIKKAEELAKKLKSFNAFVDSREDYSAGWKFSEWEMKGIPVRIEIGPKDIEKKQAVVVRRDTGEKIFVPEDDVRQKVKEILANMQRDMLAKAGKFLKESIFETADWDAFESMIKARKIVRAPHCGKTECEDLIKDKTEGASARCIPFDDTKPTKNCVHCGKKARYHAYFSKSY